MLGRVLTFGTRDRFHFTRFRHPKEPLHFARHLVLTMADDTAPRIHEDCRVKSPPGITNLSLIVSDALLLGL
ncbi:hypothetical protein CA13_29310 [Planctomycetes bacterium CA13]|uniref:Uncharacterized protein n=1 Tax=Novipirellula herctigrandis TaxID=2527986 RepID=A0A5C5Z2C2_9BACT|nr:hypothetical protein CA13_29310 [Planctomycetes bacterium CA13]